MGFTVHGAAFVNVVTGATVLSSCSPQQDLAIVVMFTGSEWLTAKNAVLVPAPRPQFSFVIEGYGVL